MPIAQNNAKELLMEKNELVLEKTSLEVRQATFEQNNRKMNNKRSEMCNSTLSYVQQLNFRSSQDWTVMLRRQKILTFISIVQLVINNQD